MTDDLESVKEKVAKLMAMGTDGRGNEFEAEIALRQAEALMRKHGIDVAMLQDSTGAKPIYNWKSVHVPVHPKRAVKDAPLWFGWILVGVGRFTDTKVAYAAAAPHGLCAKFAGDEVDVEFAVYLCKHLRDECRNLSSLLTGAVERETFRRGYASRVRSRMTNMRRERDAALREAVTSTGTALVVVEDKLALRDEQFGKQEYGRGGRAGIGGGSSNAFAAGRAAGDRASFARPVGHTSQARLK